MNGMERIPVREQDPKVRATNFEEVCLGYNAEEAAAEAARCLQCKNPQCVKGCPVSIDIPRFIAKILEGSFDEAYGVISEASTLPAVCGRVCPQESQCEGKCVRGMKGDPVAIGKLERFAADHAKEAGIRPHTDKPANGRRVAVIGAGPAGLTAAWELRRKSREWNVVVLEESPFIGGISRTAVCGDCRIDIGGHRFFSKSKEVNDL